MVGMADNRPVVTVVTTSLVIVTSLQTVLEVRDGDQVVDGPATAPAWEDSLQAAVSSEGEHVPTPAAATDCASSPRGRKPSTEHQASASAST